MAPPAPVAPGGHRRRRAPLVRKGLGAAGWAAGVVVAFTVYLRLAQTREVNSDGAAQALQAWDILHGNPLLRGWTLSDVSFYPTELLQYALIELVRGLRADVVDIAAAMTYTLAGLLAALLARGGATGREAAARVALAAGIMLAPQLGPGTNVLLSSPDHIGTCVPLLATWLVLDRGPRRWYLPVLTSVLLAWAQIADSIVLVAGIIPLALVCGVRAVRSARARDGRAAGYEAAVGGGALAAAATAPAVLAAITGAGGFTVRPLGTAIAPLGEIAGHNLRVTADCVLVLFGAYPGGPSDGEWAGFPLLHLAGVALAGAGVALALAATLRGRLGPDLGAGDLVSQVLLAAVVVNVGAFLVTQRALDVASAREIAPVLPFAAALAGRQVRLRQLARTPWMRPLLALVAAGYLAGLGAELSVPAAPPQAARLTAWLTSHPLPGTGLGGYWAASVVTLTSGGKVAVRPVADAGSGPGPRVGPHPGENNAAWFDPRQAAAHFVVLSPGIPGYPGFADTRAVRATWGAPARVYHVGPYAVWYWPGNLLPGLLRAELGARRRDELVDRLELVRLRFPAAGGRVGLDLLR